MAAYSRVKSSTALWPRFGSHHNAVHGSGQIRWCRGQVAHRLLSSSVALSLPWVAKELGILTKHDLLAEILLITGSPRLVQTLIAGDVDVVFAGVTALTRARLRGAEVAILGASANLSSQKLMVGRSSKIRRLEDVKGATIGVSQFGSEADTFTRNAGDGRTPAGPRC
jgi:ABC-type amino acid transport substrate-binding protein